MTTPTLSDQLREIVDAVETPTFAEIRTYDTPRPSHSPRMRVAVALAAVLVVVVIAAGAFALLRNGTNTSPASQPRVLRLRPDVIGDLPPECIITTEVGPGCPMEPSEASRYLGFEVREPSGIPVGWAPFAESLRVYQGPGAGLPQGVDSVALYVRAWGPPGSDFKSMGDCAPYVQVRERAAFTGEDPVGSSTITLGDGTIAHGQMPTSGCGAAAAGFGGEVAWVSDGRSIVVEGNGVTSEQFLAIARSLDR